MDCQMAEHVRRRPGKRRALRNLIKVAIALYLGLVAPVAAGLPADWFETLADGSVAYGNGDWAKALRLLRPLAENGFCLAQSNLGTMYELGWGVPQDYVIAHMWFNLSAAQGCVLSEFSASERDNLAFKMTRAQIAKAQKLAREWKPK
jgi:TPR repeat protein